MIMASWRSFHAVALWVVIMVFPAGTEQRMSMQSALQQKLLSEYGPSTVRPVYNTTQKTTVAHRLLITQVIDLNEKHQTIQISGWLRQRWEDEFLTWDPAEYGGVSRLFVDRANIWIPDTTLYKNVDREFESYKDISAQVTSNGIVSWATPVILKCTCLIDARLFPFDTQICEFRFSSWAFDGSEVDLVEQTGATAVQDQFADNGVWELLKVDVVRVEQYYACCDAPYPEVSYKLHLKRRPLFHVLNILLPCVLLSILNLMVFALPPECGEKIQLGMTNLLALVLFQQLISESLPPTSDKSPIIGFYFTPMIGIGCSSIMCTVLVLSLFYHEKSRPVPKWLRWVTLKLATVVFFPVKGHQTSAESPDGGTGTCNPAFVADSEAKTHNGYQDSDSGVMTASCSFTDSSRSVIAEEGYQTAERSEGTTGGDTGTQSEDTGTQSGHTRCRAYSMHVVQKLYTKSTNGEHSMPNGVPNTSFAMREPGTSKRKLPTKQHVVLEWKQVAQIIDRFTMILSVLVTFGAMLVTVIYFFKEI